MVDCFAASPYCCQRLLICLLATFAGSVYKIQERVASVELRFIFDVVILIKKLYYLIYVPLVCNVLFISL